MDQRANKGDLILSDDDCVCDGAYAWIGVRAT